MKSAVEGMKKIPMSDIVESPQQQPNRTKGIFIAPVLPNRQKRRHDYYICTVRIP
ncbi:TPA: hypothetical protein ACORDH_005971 [Bacillus cereus]